MKQPEQAPVSDSVSAPPVTVIHRRGGRAGLRVTCAWCGEVIEEGPGPVSHGMCGSCRTTLMATVPEA